jgi:hypothetical protein
MGLMKGYENPKDQRLMHPYVWAYRQTSTGNWTHDYDKARSAGWESAPVWDYPGGIIEWVKACGEEVALAQFPHTAPVFLNRPLLDEWLQYRRYRMEYIDTWRDDPKMRPYAFPKMLSQCRPAFGDPCPYLRPCMNASIEAAPLESGLFIARTPHHASETLARKEGLI